MSLMSSLIKTNLSKLIGLSHLNCTQNVLNRQLMPNVNAMDVRYRCGGMPSPKRRKTFPFHWWAQKDKRKDVPKRDNTTQLNKEFIDQYIKDKYELKAGESPLKSVQLERGEYTPGSKRTGVIAKKIGSYPMWTKTGKRVLTTALQVVDNHIIKYHSNEKYSEARRPFYTHHKYRNLAVVVVGAENDDPRNYAAAYRGLFEEAAVMPKKRLTRFFISENAKLAPGTPLHAAHFRVGDYVDVWGKTKDYGWQGVIKRWKFRGMPKFHGVTKSHRRGGTIGRGRKACGPFKGTKMPGHMGSERKVMFGLKVFRINTKHNVIWIQGVGIPGGPHSWCYIYDTRHHDKKFDPTNPPPFPTYFPDEANPLPEDIYDKELHVFDEPTLIFEETEEERKAALMALKAKKAKIAKIR